MSTVESQIAHKDSHACSPCVACRIPLPIRPSRHTEAGQYWHCVQCDTKHYGVRLDDPSADCAANARRAAESSGILFAASRAGAHIALGAATEALPGRGPIVCHHQTRTSKTLDNAIASGRILLAASNGPPLLSALKQHGAHPYDMECAAQFVDQYDQSVSQLESLVASIEQGDATDLKVTESITRDALGKAMKDFDLFVRLGINPPPADYTNRHSLHVAMLAASIGANRGWDEKTLLELGMGCLLHDIGMSQVTSQTHRTGLKLNDREYAEIAEHPLHTFDLLADHLENVSLTSHMVAYQIHERCNGTGYPRGSHGAQIHEVAKVAAVADVYVALVSPRPHRPALMPYHAILHLIHGVNDGAFDGNAVRALLRTVSLFPIGSYLELQDGRKARVLRSNPAEFCKPIVETWLPSELDANSTIIDLSTAPQVAIKCPLPNLAPEQ